MVFSINFSFVSNISVIGNVSNLECCRLKKRFAGLTIYSFPKYSNTARIG